MQKMTWLGMVLAAIVGATLAACGSEDPTFQPVINGAPTISGTPSAMAQATAVYSFAPVASDPDGNALTFSIANRPSWATFDTASGVLTGTPAAADVGSYSDITITVTDGSLSASLPVFTITVTVDSVPNQAPTISGMPSTIVQSATAYSFTPVASDPESNTLTFSIINKPSWASFNTANGALTGTPSSTQVGTYPGITITVSDGSLNASLPAFAVTVTAEVVPNRAPTISGAPLPTVLATTAYSFTPTASDPDGNALTFSIANRPSWASFSTATGALSGTPTAAQIGTYSNITIMVTDGSLSASLPAFAVTVGAVPNRVPTISGTPSSTVQATTAYSFTPAASDPDSNPLTFSITNKPAWASFNTTSGALTGTPTAAQIGTYSNITIMVSDGSLSASLAAFTITVSAAPNRAPIISGTPSSTVQATVAYSFTPAASDPDSNPLMFSITNKPAWASFNTANGALTGTPTAAQIGTYSNITITVSDGSLSVSLAAFTINVSATPNRAPTISGTPPTTVQATVAYSFTPAASDPDGGTLTFSITNKPAWASFSTATGALTGTPLTNQVGTYSNITLTVSDGALSASLPAFAVTVAAVPNRAPTISGTPPITVQANAAYSFTPTASDPDAQTLTFSIANKPSWATFSAASGALTGTPTATQVGMYPNIAITVSDGSLSASLTTFAITVTQAPATGTAQLSWTAPTQNTDGSSLSDLAGYHVYHGTSPTALTDVIEIDGTSMTTFTFDQLGEWHALLRGIELQRCESGKCAVAGSQQDHSVGHRHLDGHCEVVGPSFMY